MHPNAAAAAEHAPNTNLRFVRFRELLDTGYVLFDFAIGDPSLSVELTLSLKDYREFCRSERVIYLTREQGEALDFEHSKWRYGQPGVDQ